jgi:glycine/sarcosine N-methyltransferase
VLSGDSSDPYAGLAEHYDLIYADWHGSIRRQAAALDGVMRNALGPGARSVLDASCGIGTQALGLALLGHRVHGTDLSPAEVGRARREAAALGLSATFGVADLRDLTSQVDGTFDVVLSADNSVAHLLTEDDLGRALDAMRTRLRDEGLLLITLRDYDAMLRERPRSSTPRVIDGPAGRRVVLYIFDWEPGDETYQTSIFIVRQAGAGWTTLHWSTRSRAWRRAQVERAIDEAGFAEVRWWPPAESGFFQPIVTARQPSASTPKP